MLWLSALLIEHHDLESFDELLPVVKAAADRGELFFRMDIRPPFRDTPDNWEDRLEAVFTAAIDAQRDNR